MNHPTGQMHGAPHWGQPPPAAATHHQAFYPPNNGDHGALQFQQPHHQQNWQAPPQFHQQDPHQQQQQQQPRMAGMATSHGRGQSHVHGDDLSLRLKEEQRRRQNEYSQALSEQVRQRDAQKQREREARQREDAVESGIDQTTGQPKVERGLFDGLGQRDQNQRGNYGRGRREPPVNPIQQHQSQQQQPLLQQSPPLPMENLQQQQGWSGYSEALGIGDVPPQQHYGDPHAPHGLTPRQDAGPWNPHSPQQQHQQPQYPQQPQQQPGGGGGGGRRVRNDLHNAGAGGLVDDAQARRRQQQQLDMQDALRRQIEDKQRQKLEEKRKREDEERREMERFELDKRRQHDEQERLKEEKRRKAQAEEEHYRMQQQQLEAANAAALLEKEGQRHQRDQRNHHREPSPARAAQEHNYQSIPAVVGATGTTKPPGMPQKANPFTNSRAHLFQDPPLPAVAAAAQAPPVHHTPHLQQHHAPPPHLQQHHAPPPPVIYQQQQPVGFGGAPTHHHFGASPPLSHQSVVDTQTLMEQYEQVREELQRQRQLVEQLHAQMQQQQQYRNQHQRDDPRQLPTVSDLELLRQELREELEQREMQHRHELNSLRKQQYHQQQQEQQDQQPQLRDSHTNTKSSPPRHASVVTRHSVENQARKRHGPGRRHDAFAQDALEESLGGEEEEVEFALKYDPSQRSPCVPAQRRLTMAPSPHHRSHELALDATEPPLASSLQCESKLVFFDGRVLQPSASHAQSQIITEEPETNDDSSDGEESGEENEEEKEEEEEELREHKRNDLEQSVDGLRFRESVRVSKASDFLLPSMATRASNQDDRGMNRSPARTTMVARQPVAEKTEKSQEEEDEEDALGFFIKRFDTSSPGPERYRVGSSSTSTSNLPSLRVSHQPDFHGILQDVDDDDEDDDGSLNGEKLEAIFQRNLRRHEILLGFEARTQHSDNTAPEPLHWEELQQLLHRIPGKMAKQTRGKVDHKHESGLVASSRWMPSSVLH